MRHESVKLVSTLVPLDRVELVLLQVVAAGQVGRLALRQVGRDADGQVGQAVDD